MEPDEANAEAKKQFIEAIKQGTHVLVTVKNSPTVDQLASCIALTLLLNELGKRATAVFSGKVPPSIEFLEPGKMLQKTTNSLQDFIISLDKVKADKLRYKVEDTMVKIYITPYQTSISDKDLVYSKGDFNVDVVIALGAHSQAELDHAITAHGRILHDATVISMNNEDGPTSDLGSVNWVDDKASSLSEMLAQAVEELADGKQDVLDDQISTALLAGIVAETESFGNSKTTPTTMEVAAQLLTSGANQELVATKLTGPLKHDSPTAHADSESHPHARKHKETSLEKDAAKDAEHEADDSHEVEPDKSVDETSDTDTVAEGELTTGTAQAVHGDPELPDESVDIIGQPEATTLEAEAEPETSKEESPLADAVDTSALAEVATDLADASDVSADAPAEAMDAAAAVTDPAVGATDPNEGQPQVYDLSDSNAPASVPDAPAEAPTETPAASDSGLLQPLRDQIGAVTDPPLYDKAATAAQEGSTEPVDTSLDPTKFALTPPSLGGRLSGAGDAEEPTPPANPLAEAQSSGPAVVTHHAMMTHGAPGVPGSSPDTPAAADTAPAGPVEMHHEKKLVVPSSTPEAEPAPATPSADSSNPLAGLEVIDPNAGQLPTPIAPASAPAAPAATAPAAPPTSFGTTDENELAALGIIQPGNAGPAAPSGMPSLTMPMPNASPAPGLAPAQPLPAGVGSAPPLVAPPQPAGPFTTAPH